VGGLLDTMLSAFEAQRARAARAAAGGSRRAGRGRRGGGGSRGATPAAEASVRRRVAGPGAVGADSTVDFGPRRCGHPPRSGGARAPGGEQRARDRGDERTDHSSAGSAVNDTRTDRLSTPATSVPRLLHDDASGARRNGVGRSYPQPAERPSGRARSRRAPAPCGAGGRVGTEFDGETVSGPPPGGMSGRWPWRSPSPSRATGRRPAGPTGRHARRPRAQLRRAPAAASGRSARRAPVPRARQPRGRWSLAPAHLHVAPLHDAPVGRIGDDRVGARARVEVVGEQRRLARNAGDEQARRRRVW
jgi:hypothetical protein